MNQPNTQKVLEDLIERVYKRALRPRVVNGTFWDLREDLVEQIHEIFEQPELVALVPDKISEILTDLRNIPVTPPASAS